MIKVNYFYICRGVSKHGYIPPAKLAEYDLVITTYGVLSTEINYVDLPHTNSQDGRRLEAAFGLKTSNWSLLIYVYCYYTLGFVIRSDFSQFLHRCLACVGGEFVWMKLRWSKVVLLKWH
jgi:hypothetical protein